MRLHVRRVIAPMPQLQKVKQWHVSTQHVSLPGPACTLLLYRPFLSPSVWSPPVSLLAPMLVTIAYGLAFPCEHKTQQNRTRELKTHRRERGNLLRESKSQGTKTRAPLRPQAEVVQVLARSPVRVCGDLVRRHYRENGRRFGSSLRRDSGTTTAEGGQRRFR